MLTLILLGVWSEAGHRIIANDGGGPRAFVEAFPGVRYTVVRVYEGAVLGLPLHAARLGVSEERVLRAVRRVGGDLVAIVSDEENDLLCAKSWASSSPLRMRKPMRVGLREGRRLAPDVKNTSWAISRRRYEDNSTDETILCWKGEMLEGLVSNVCAVFDATTIVSPKDGVLEGVGLAMALDAARTLGLRVERRSLRCEEVFSAAAAAKAAATTTELFLTNANFLVAPVAEIHENPREDGGPPS
ncbi:hypothetical protein CTAYLR_003981 [Chrysophaeum taylorii]|uniref:Uncharacterized protein n=1 Tax=Chrysophaeum taylorii TaxID=2483200 RepID=A0AAD7UFT6_9STRA|nr:hypothetical protein CTAYLR_003981 [Chrysophaeum taylorii]